VRTIGLLGGMSWESSIEYYRMLNEAVRDRLGGLHSAECVMWSVDFAPIEIPLLHIADATAARVRAAGADTVGLLATRYAMEQDFYRGRLAERHGLDVLVPPEPDLTLVHEVIYRELCQGRVLDGSREEYRRVIAELEAAGADGIIYGCTEIDLLVGPEDASVPVFDSTRIHVETAVEWALTPAGDGAPFTPA
jgi:aspartate racemase